MARFPSSCPGPASPPSRSATTPLRSDAYVITDDFLPLLNPACGGIAPIISLDSKMYKIVAALEEGTADGVLLLVDYKRMGRSTRFVGNVSVVNKGDEAKYLSGKIEDAELDVTDKIGLGLLRPTIVKSASISRQKPGTSGLCKKTKELTSEHYLKNFVQSVFDAVIAGGTNVSEGTLLVGGNRRYFNNKAIQTIVKMGVANGGKQV